MLRELHISNLAVIADARIEFTRGLNCFTGTTGAGKSLVIGAIEVLLGLRSPADMLRTGVEEGRVSGVFEIADKSMLRQLELATDLPLSAEAGELLITRRLFASGRSSVSLNGNPITLSMLKLVAETLIDVHGQHDHQFLLRPANQLLVVDEYAQLSPLRDRYATAWATLRQAQQHIAELLAGRNLRNQQLELYKFQLQEIQSAELQPGEFEELGARSSVLANVEKLKKEASTIHSALYEADGSVLSRLKMMAGVLSELSELDQALKPIAQTVRESTLQLEDAAFDLSRYLDRLELDPGELNEVNDRLNTIHRLVNKYGDSVAQVISYQENIAAQIVDLEKQTDDLASAEKRLEPMQQLLGTLAEELSRKRKAAADKLAPMIERQLSELGMDRATFSIHIVSGETHHSASGQDVVEFVVQTNPGQAAQPLRKIASGGELSRIMLALKSVLAAGERVSVLVFDEIDSNVGGRLGAIIGQKLRDLARHHQVLCITHLPQIACYADRHLTVRKLAEGKKTETTVRVMEGAARLEELAEMIGGQRITETTRSQARELLEAAMPANRAEPPRPARTISKAKR